MDLTITDRQRRLLWEMATMVDVDTLNDNLNRVSEEETGAEELEQLCAVLDPDGRYADEWATLESAPD